MPDKKGTEKQPQPEDEEDDKEKQSNKKDEEEKDKHNNSEQNQKQPEDGEPPHLEKEADKREEPYLADLELDLAQRPRSLGSNVIQESADYVLQLLHAYAAAFGL